MPHHVEYPPCYEVFLLSTHLSSPTNMGMQLWDYSIGIPIIRLDVRETVLFAHWKFLYLLICIFPEHVTPMSNCILFETEILNVYKILIGSHISYMILRPDYEIVDMVRDCPAWLNFKEVPKVFKDVHESMWTHFPLDKMAAISQAIFSDALLRTRSFVFWFEIHWSLFRRVRLTITQHSFS